MSMKILLGLSWAVILPSVAWAQSAVLEAPASSATTVETKPFLWEVRSETSTSYLLGSLHVARPNLYPLAEGIESAFAGSDKLVVEADVDSVDPAKLGQMILSKAVNLTGVGLEDRLSHESLATLKTFLEDAPVSMAQLSQFKPWYVSQLITVLELNRLGINPEFGIDKHFLKQARGKKEILELEGLEEQLGFLDGFSNQEQDLMLRYTLRDLENLESLMDEMIDAWKTGDADNLDRLLNGYVKESEGLEQVFEKLFAVRNKKMDERIREYLKTEHSYFIIVGAGHLVGEEGLIQSLTQDGLSVQQVESIP